MHLTSEMIAVISELHFEEEAADLIPGQPNSRNLQGVLAVE
jgi:hypothetical protein